MDTYGHVTEALMKDSAKNAAYAGQGEACLSSTDSRVAVWVIPTDEERVIFNEIRNMK